MADRAVPVPVRVIAELLGVDPDRFEDVKRWSQAAIAIFGQQASPDVAAAANAGTTTNLRTQSRTSNTQSPFTHASAARRTKRSDRHKTPPA